MAVIIDGIGGGGGGGVGIEFIIDIGTKTPIRAEEEPSCRSEERGGPQPQRRERKRKRVVVPRMLTEISIDDDSHFNLLSSSSSGGGSSHHWLRSKKPNPIICSRPLPPPKAKLNNATLSVKKEKSYRPKVVTDLPTPKPVTPSLAPAEKKLYGRKRKWNTDGKKITNSSNTPDNDLKMAISQIKNQSRTSCRKALIFDDEDMTLAQMINSNMKLYGKNKASTGGSTLRVPEIVYDGNERDQEKVYRANLKQQEQETQLLLERVEKFMSSMKNVQGDRHVSRWKGSVLDSVVGAFLAQNGTDTQSSSAFMNLAAQYPIGKILPSQERMKSKRVVKKTGSSLSLKSQLTKKRNVDFDKKKKGGKVTKEKNKGDWETLRKSYTKAEEGYRDINDNNKDSLDWYAVNSAEVNEISKAIECRGMNNKLAARIKKCLSRLIEEHGSVDLEWLRSLPQERATEFLLSIRGMGAKSVECIRLLTLQHAAFPVDTHVARIAMRLGWVPLQPLPEGIDFHGLKENPVVDTVHKYLSDRLRLEPEKLKELHIQMITFGKVFCTKTSPNCNACPMRGDCKYFASECASNANGPPKKTSKPSAACTDKVPAEAKLSELRCQLEQDIEDLFLDFDPPIINKSKAFMKNKPNYTQENHIPFEKNELDGVLTDINTTGVFLSVTKQKKIDQLRTKHNIYELPDSHSLLEKFDKRDKDDHCPYLLATWNIGQTENSSQPSKGKHISDLAEEECQTQLGTLLIPCRTATRGFFPLDGTFFQTNEVFADHETSICPIKVPPELIDGLQRNTLYCGNFVRVIYQGLPIEEIRVCFQKGYVCLKGFDRGTRKPTSLEKLLHCTPEKSKIKREIKIKKTVVKTKKTVVKTKPRKRTKNKI